MRDMTNQYEARITIQSNNRASPVDEYYHTDGNTYFEARQGSEFVLDLFNRSSERVAMIPAIDGLSTVDGQPAGLDSPGFVVEPWGSVRVPGWSKSEHSAAHFVFWDKENSYSNKTGRGKENVGVIGVLVFREKPRSNMFTPYPYDTFSVGSLPNSFPETQSWNGNESSGNSWGGLGGNIDSAGISVSNAVDTQNSILGSSASASSSTSATRSTRSTRRLTKGLTTSGAVQEAGTGHGRITEFNTTEVNFEKRDPKHPDAQVVIYYDTSRGLEKRGIVLKYKKNFAPDPFPSSPGYYNNTRKG